MGKKADRGYVRVSTLKDSQKDSPEHQEAFIRETATRMGIKIDRIYSDSDSATSIINREDVQEMIEDAKRGDIRTLFFTSLSRFSRDALDAISLKRILVNALKVRVVSIEDGYDSGIKDDELLFGIKSVVNQNTSGDISVSSRRGLRQSAASGNFTGSYAPYGYKKVNIDDPKMKSGKRKTLEVIPEHAEIVKLIFEKYIGGMGETSIVNFLNGDNGNREPTPSAKGGLWGITTVQRLLQNENYTGYTVSGRLTTEVAYNDLSDLMDRGTKLVMKPKSEWEKTNFITHEAIISVEQFNLAQETRMLRGGGARGGNRDFVNVFAKMVFCSECGGAMVTMSSLTRGKLYRYLMCSRRRRMGRAGCVNNRWIEYFDFRDVIIKEILVIVKSLLKSLKKKGLGSIDQRLPDNNYEKERAKLEKKVIDNRTLLFEIRRENMLGNVDSNQYEFEKALYEKEIEEIEKRLAVIKVSEKQALDIERNMKELKVGLDELVKLKSYDDVEKTRRFLNKLVDRIDIDPEGIAKVKTKV